MALPDVLTSGLRVVIVGTAPAAPASGHYYAGRGNLFWQLLHEAGLTTELLTPEQDRLVVRYGIGLTDLHKSVEVHGRERTEHWHVREFTAKLLRSRPGVVAFVSATAAGAYARGAGLRGLRPGPWGPTPWPVAGLPGFVLPGPSGANNAMPLPLRIALWRDLADFLDTQDPPSPTV
jgi:double-stranded uracil-DNA glycosylase